MPYALGAIQVQAGQSYTVPVGSAGTVGAVVCANESPYAVNASISATGAPGQWIVAQTADLIACDVSGFNGTLTFTTDNYLSNAASAPSFLLYLTAYAPGEAIRGTYPAPLMRLASGITSIVESPATTIEQDLLTAFVYGASSLVATKNALSPNQLDVTTGIAFPQQSDGSLLRTAVAATHFLTISPSATYYLDLNPDGSWSWTTSHSTQPNYLAVAQVTTDASSNILTVTDERVLSTILLAGMTNNPGAPGLILYNLHVFKDIQADDQISVQGSYKTTSGATGNGYLINIGSNDALYFQPTGSTQQQGAVFYYWVPGSGALPIFSLIQPVGAVYIDASGVIHAPSPMQLITGHQETGAAIVGGTDAAGAFRLNGVNFKTVLANTPTSITLTVTSSSNIASVGAQDISKYGFAVQYQATAAAFSLWNGTYTTVGNCLLGVNAAAQTLDHHCDVCGHVSRAAPFSSLSIRRPDPTSNVALTLGYSCPSCGALEAFNLALTAADEADATPQGSGPYATTRGAQAALIRQLLTALGLEVAP